MSGALWNRNYTGLACEFNPTKRKACVKQQSAYQFDPYASETTMDRKAIMGVAGLIRSSHLLLLRQQRERATRSVRIVLVVADGMRKRLAAAREKRLR